LEMQVNNFLLATKALSAMIPLLGPVPKGARIRAKGYCAIGACLSLLLPVLASNSQLTIDEAVGLKAAFDGARSGGHSQIHWIPHTHTLAFSRKEPTARTPAIYLLNVDRNVKTQICEGSDPLVSPDGTKLAFLRKADGTGKNATEIWISNIDGSTLIKASGTIAGLGLPRIVWSPDSARLLYWFILRDKSRHSLDVATDLGGGSAVKVFPSAYAHIDMGHIRVFDVRDHKDREVHEQSGDGGEPGWLDNNTIIFEQDDGKPPSQMSAEVVSLDLNTNQEHSLITKLNRQPVYFPRPSPHGDQIAFLADPMAEVFYPYRTDLALLHVKENKVQFLTNNEWVGSDYSWSSDGKWLLFSSGSSTEYNIYANHRGGETLQITKGVGDNSSPSLSDDGRLLAWIFTAPDATESLRVASWNVGHPGPARDLLTLSAPTRNITGGTFSAIRWKSHDGLMIDGFLTLPVGYRKDTRYPTVVIVHGGPTGGPSPLTDEWPGGIYFTEYLAQHGYVVFQPDYRTSQRFGFDKILEERARDELFAPDSGDIMSGVSYLENEGIADPSRLALLGHSWGSAEANWILTHTDSFAAAVSFEGIDILMDWGTSFGPNAALEWYLRGSPVERPQAYYQNWAPNFVKGVKTPTLFVTSTAESGASRILEWLYSGWLEQRVDSQFINYPNESHIIERREAQIDLMQRIMEWLEKHGVK
jgi:dipeptidyl aminopeptidase/acylaminoacyl peptidase